MNCKLTRKDGTTYGGMQWGDNVSNTAIGEGNKLCAAGVIHYYADPLLAVFADPIHGNFGKNSILWEFKPAAEVVGDALKKVCKMGTTIRQIEKPAISVLQRAEIAIRLSLLVYTEEFYIKWATAWLDGTDRTACAAYYAAGAAYYAADYAAYYAAGAARAAADYAADYAARAADYAALAADYATRAAANIDIMAVIKQVVNNNKKEVI